MIHPKPGIWYFIRTVGGWIYLIPLIVGLIMGGVAVANLHKGWDLQAHGTTVTGQVKDLFITTRSCGKENRDTCTDYNVDLAFEVAGRMRDDQTTVSSGFYSKLTKGGPIPVRYVTAEPAVFEVELGGTMTSAIFLGLLALGFLAPAAYALKTRVDLGRRMIRLRETGTPRKAQVTAREMTGTRINNVKMWRMRWRDETGAGGQSRMQREQDLPEFGSTITVYADPEGKLPPVWEGDSGTR